MPEQIVEIVDRHGRRRRAKRGETLRDGERFSLPMTFMDSALQNALVEKYGGNAAVCVAMMPMRRIRSGACCALAASGHAAAAAPPSSVMNSRRCIQIM